ncbi:uncharacterized protein Z520_06759 [Fonsecaea multimorphosa CBS 102226]|uniref:Uncharacterized protein n=1 Tax=Fonsecaea multimorphosa CBS 102226 TaxID=1442371 RepID=A0A0D2JV07_9EURO|nr:uncharacterized protein Z520_06759 [Fonsecaea multimorphosa CBS 102226]KIX97307.1 hypothetical protein Z520_06759 [Fonsecaea multimorphosa CBS 102226]OAL23274.1 hypothetical protein AYO22_06324 [Fonsecaea multimorphosa]
MTSHYSRLDRQDSSRELLGDGAINSADGTPSIPLRSMEGHALEDWARPGYSDDSLNDRLKPGNDSEDYLNARPGVTGQTYRTNSGFSIPSVASSPWEHKLNEKHLRDVPTNTDTVRYFDPRRQTRRVFIDCLLMWCWTAGICGALAGTMYGFSTIQTGLSHRQKYVYNAMITGLSIVLGLSFAAQFKQFAEMMRWRFLASQYRSLQDFEDVLGCDSYRSTLRIMWSGRRTGTWYPSKAQVVAAVWLLIFVVFNTFAALLGLTYSIDVSDDFVSVNNGIVNVANLQYIASQPQPNNGQGYDFEFQKAAANLWGQVGQNFPVVTTTLDGGYDQPGPFVFTTAARDMWWYRFVDLGPDLKTAITSTRTVTSQAHCEEYKVLFGGYAGFNTDNATLTYFLEWEDNQGNKFGDIVTNVATAFTTWMGNSSSKDVGCGPRCSRILALQSADNHTVPHPRMWSCNNTVGQVQGIADGGFSDPDALTLPDDQAFYLAGSIGWTGLETESDDLQYFLFDGDTPFNPPGNATAETMAELVMKFTVGALSALDNMNGPTKNLTGAASPSPAQVVNVKWADAGAILAGIPFVQFLLLVGVVWFSDKAIILEPSFMTVAHLLFPVIRKVGQDGCLLTVDEMADRLGHAYKIAYGVRPHPADPGHHDTTFVRDLDVIEESEGYGYIRGRFPEGRYD